MAARCLEKAEALAKELGATPVQLDVSDAASCLACARLVAALRKGRPLTVVHNAGVAYDLPWFPTPWPQQAAKDTLDAWPCARDVAGVTGQCNHKISYTCMNTILI